ncbi:hypothetical protein X953_05275 [Virgibacillus sp. SK37]|nr:hypothetical protein X953_05275 [Virgibacillus sp. SK37]
MNLIKDNSIGGINKDLFTIFEDNFCTGGLDLVYLIDMGMGNPATI